MKNKRFFPIFVDLSDKKIVVVGGGNIATRRIKTLLQFTRNITAVAPKTTMELHELGKAGFVNLIDVYKSQAFSNAAGISQFSSCL